MVSRRSTPPSAAISPDVARLRQQAIRVLEANWRGMSTVPTPTLYPHQWSWDSAFIAVGLAHVDVGRAWTELTSLFESQWADGRVPQIVFNQDIAEDAYFPGPAFWQPLPPAGPPSGVATTGLVQPPVHAAAALAVAERSSPEDALGPLRALYPRLVAYHEYLWSHRALESGLIAIVHPWESGMDNSPLWDAALSAMSVEVPDVGRRRRDVRHVSPSDRPTNADYARYIGVAEAYRDRGYSDEALPDLPFRMVDPLFNTLLAWSERALAELAARLGLPSDHHIERADTLEAALHALLFDADLGCYTALDGQTGHRATARTVGGLAPLLLDRIPRTQRAVLVKTAAGPSFGVGDRRVRGVPSYDLQAPDLDLRRYWRGPAWINTSWLVWKGLLRSGERQLAWDVASGMLALVNGAGFREYFNPLTGEGLGADDFSWSAALILDVLSADRD